MLEKLKARFGIIPRSAAIGKLGEDAAAQFLKRTRKMKIVTRNFRNAHTEIDIIAKDSNGLVFVEVKTRSTKAIVDGYYAAVSSKKIAAVRKCAYAYMASMQQRPFTWRFDVVDVRINDDLSIESVAHFENIG